MPIIAIVAFSAIAYVIIYFVFKGMVFSLLGQA